MRLELSRIIEGVLFDPRDNIQKYKQFHTRENPLYIVDLVIPQGTFLTVANCYQIDKGSLKHYLGTEHTLYDVSELVKARKNKFVKRYPFGKHPTTHLAKAAFNRYEEKPELKTKVFPPLFSSIIGQAHDTFSGQQERCIFEREPTHTEVSGFSWLMNKKSTKVEGKLTGVKIGLSNFLPIRHVIPQKQVVSQLKKSSQSILELYLGEHV